MQDKPLVSIIIPCYNREAYISDAIDSCIRQTYSNIEIIVVDDGSTDNSVEIIQQYGKKVTLITQSNQGVSVARNTGLNQAKGKYVIMLDSDDWLSDDIVEKHLATHSKWPEIAISCTDSRSIDSNGQQSEIIPSNWPDTPTTPTELFLLIPPPFPACEMYKTDVMKELGGYFEDLKAFADSSLRLRIILNNHQVVRTQGGYAIYRPVANSITKNRLKLHANGIKLIEKLKTEFSDSQPTLQLLEQRKIAQRLRYWFDILAFHTSLKPLEIIKFTWHLLKVTKVDGGYPLFILKTKPWKKNKSEAF